MLRRAVEALPLARERVPELRTVAVAGPRIDPATSRRYAAAPAAELLAELL